FVSAPEEVCISRICKRDGISPYKAEQRLASQMNCEELRRLCDEEIKNGDGCDPASQVERICEKYGL
ncbi:MAG: dephospho-CoA kinase, partial [Candidatus Avispirillum sp.]